MDSFRQDMLHRWRQGSVHYSVLKVHLLGDGGFVHMGTLANVLE